MGTKGHSAEFAVQVIGIADLHKMSFKEVDCTTVINHCNHCIDHRCTFGVEDQKRNTEKYRGLFLVDMFFSKLKIVIGFYQVTNGLLEAFSYIKWPGSLEVIAKYSGILQMNR